MIVGYNSSLTFSQCQRGTVHSGSSSKAGYQGMTVTSIQLQSQSDSQLHQTSGPEAGSSAVHRSSSAHVKLCLCGSAWTHRQLHLETDCQEPNGHGRRPESRHGQRPAGLILVSPAHVPWRRVCIKMVCLVCWTPFFQVPHLGQPRPVHSTLCVGKDMSMKHSAPLLDTHLTWTRQTKLA